MASENAWRPTPQQLDAARGARVRDVIGEGLDVLFCGINPGLYSGAVGHHFARPGNRFWKALHLGGFTQNLLSPWEERQLLELGLGITNMVGRTTASASELSTEELRRGARLLARKVARCSPRVVAFLGISSYRTGFERPRDQVGRQEETLGGAVVWVLPNPSGLNAHYQLDALVRAFSELRASTRGSSSRRRRRPRSHPKGSHR